MLLFFVEKAMTGSVDGKEETRKRWAENYKIFKFNYNKNKYVSFILRHTVKNT